MVSKSSYRAKRGGETTHDPSAQTTQDDPDRHQTRGTLVTARLPADEFALAETLTTVSDLQVTCASIGASGKTAAFPLVWFHTTELDKLDAALETDSTVTTAEALVHVDDRHLYRMEWDSGLRWLCQLLLTSRAICLDAQASESDWQIEILYPDREALQETDEFCDQYDLSFTIESVRTIDPERTTQCGLTPAQYEAMTAACQLGYFSVPREANLEEVAAEVGVSHQALSERLRRGHETLITAVLNGFQSPSGFDLGGGLLGPAT